MFLSEKYSKKKLVGWLFITLFLATAQGANTLTTESSGADNTRVNQRDQKGNTLTAQDQAQGSAADVELTRKIRQELTKDNTLSTDAKNIKVITLNGVTTLRGPVTSMAEKSKVESLAKKVSGVSKVDNQTEVKTKTY